MHATYTYEYLMVSGGKKLNPHPSPVQPYHANQTTEIWCIELPSPPPPPVKMIGILLSSFYPALLYVPVEHVIS